MLLILLVIFIKAFLITAEENDSFETRYIDLLPAKEKREFIETIARRILEEIKPKDAATKGSTEISDDQLNKHSAYVSKLLKEEAESLRKRTKGESRRGTDPEDAEKQVKDKSIDFTLRELAHNPELQEITSTTNKTVVARELKNTTDNISVEIQIVPQKKKKKTHTSRIFKIKTGSSASKRENATMIVIGSDNKPLPEKEITNTNDDGVTGKLPVHVTRADIFKDSPQKQEDDNQNNKKEDKQSDPKSENHDENDKNDKQETEVKGENLKSDNKVKNTEDVNPGKSDDDNSRSYVYKERESITSEGQNKSQIDSSKIKNNNTASAADNIPKISRRNADNDDKDLDESDKSDPKTGDTKSNANDKENIEDRKRPVGIEDDIKTFSDSKSNKTNKEPHDGKPVARNRDKLESSEIINDKKRDDNQSPKSSEGIDDKKHKNKQKTESTERVDDEKHSVERIDNKKDEVQQKSDPSERNDDVKHEAKQKSSSSENNDDKKYENKQKQESNERFDNKKHETNQKSESRESLNNEKHEDKQKPNSKERADDKTNEDILKSESNDRTDDKKREASQKLQSNEQIEDKKHDDQHKPESGETIDNNQHDNKQKLDSGEMIVDKKQENKQKSESKEKTNENKHETKQESKSSEKDDVEKYENKQRLESNERIDNMQHDNKQKPETSAKTDGKNHEVKQHASKVEPPNESKTVSKSEKSGNSEPTTLSLQDHPVNSTQVAIPGDLTNPLQASSLTTKETAKVNHTGANEDNNKEINTVNNDDTINTGKIHEEVSKVDPTTEIILGKAFKPSYASDEDNSTKMGDIFVEKEESVTEYDSKEFRGSLKGKKQKHNTETTTEDIVKARTKHITWYPGHTTIDYDKETTTEKCKKKSTIEMIQAKTRYVHWPTDEATERVVSSADRLHQNRLVKRLPKSKLFSKLKRRPTVTIRPAIQSTTTAASAIPASDKKGILSRDAPVIIKHNQVYIVNDGAAFKEKLTKRIEVNKRKRVDIYSKTRKTKNKSTKSKHKKNKTKEPDILNFQIKPFGVNIAKEWSVFEVLPGENPFVTVTGKVPSKPKKQSKKSPIFDRNNAQRSRDDRKRHDDVDSQVEQPSYAPVYNFAPENAYYNPANRYSPPEEYDDLVMRKDEEDEDKKVERQLKEREKGFLESDETEERYVPVYNYAPENAFYNPANRYAAPDEENEQNFRDDIEDDPRQAERQRTDDEKIVKALLEAQDDGPESELLFREEPLRKGKKKNTLNIPGSNERAHPYNAMLYDNPPKSHIDHVREMLHRLNYFGYHHLVKTTTGKPTELTTRFPINAPFKDKSGDPYFSININVNTTGVPEVTPMPPGEQPFRAVAAHLRSRNAKDDLQAALQSLLSPRFDDENEKLARTLLSAFAKIREKKKQRRKSKSTFNDIVKRIIGLDSLNTPIHEENLNRKLKNVGPRGYYQNFDKNLYALRVGEEKPEGNDTESKHNETDNKAEMIKTMREVLDLTDATYIFPALAQIEKKYEEKDEKKDEKKHKEEDGDKKTDKPVVRSLESGVQKAHVTLETQVSVLTDMLNADNRALENYDWLGTTVDIRGALRKLIEMGQSVKNDGYIHPRDLQLLKYVLFLFESVKDSLRTEEEFFRTTKPKGQRPKARRNQDRIVERPWLSRSGMKQKLDAFVMFWEGIDYALSDLHDAIKHIAIITKYRNQHWYKNLKELYLSQPRRKQVLEVLLHLATTRFVGLVEDSALNGAENNYVKYAMKNVTQVDRTRDELVFIVALLNELLKQY